MAKVIGIDPDSEAHGVAVYVDGKLEFLGNVSLMGIINDPYFMDGHFSIENVCYNSAVFEERVLRASAQAARRMANNVGMCQQAQTELMRALEWHQVSYELHRPSSCWKQNIKQFEQVTGWTKRSNKDNRSAAYFGFLALKKPPTK